MEESLRDAGHPYTEGGACELLAAVPEESSRSLVHLLDCPYCRDIALADLADVVESRGVNPAPVADPETDALLAELLALSERGRAEALKDRRFHRDGLFDVLLETGRATLTRNAGQAAKLAASAVWLATELADGRAIRPRMLRAYCLDGTARRLLGELKAADTAFDNAAYFLGGESEEVGLYARSLALLRWEEGRWHDAAALLRHGADAYGEIKWRREQGVCHALLGLVYLEAGEIRRAAWPLLRGLRSPMVEQRSHLLACCSLSAALCMALLGAHETARQARENAWLAHIEPQPSEQAEVSWLAGRLSAALGEAEEADRLLDSARVQLLAGRRIADAALASLDLAVIYAATTRAKEIDRLAAELKEAGGEREEAVLGADTLRDYAKAKPSRGNAERKAAVLSAYLRRSLRVRFTGLQTLPWT